MAAERVGTTAEQMVELADSMGDPPCPSYMATSGAASDGECGLVASEGGGKTGAKGGAGGGKLKSTFSPHTWNDHSVPA